MNTPTHAQHIGRKVILSVGGLLLILALAWFTFDRESRPSLATERSLGSVASLVESAPVALLPVSPEAVGRTESRFPADDQAPDTEKPTLEDHLSSMRGDLESIAPYDGTTRSLEEKYKGLGPQDLHDLYPIVRDLYQEDLFRNLDEAINSGQYVSEIVPRGQSVDFSKYDTPGQSLNVYAHRAEPLPGGGYEYKIAVFDQVRFPDMYSRAMEESWVHYQIHKAGLCEHSKPSTAKITYSE